MKEDLQKDEEGKEDSQKDEEGEGRFSEGRGSSQSWERHSQDYFG